PCTDRPASLREPSFFLVLIRRPPPLTLFPYTTLFRSAGGGERGEGAERAPHAQTRVLATVHELLGLHEELDLTDATAPELHVARSEEHTSELQSPYDLVCRLLLEKKNIPATSSSPHSS